MYREPEPNEVRTSGYAWVTSLAGHVERVPSCALCASTLGLPWVSDLFEGTCRGCDVSLSGLVER